MAPGDIVILPYCRYVVDTVTLTVREAMSSTSRGASTPS
jgi:hypothetical protein